MRGALHTEFETITIHTAKCDLCNKHNTSQMFRCVKCGRQCCKPCWDSKGGDGRHQLHNKEKLAYTGPKAEALPPVVRKVKSEDMGVKKETGSEKGKGKGKDVGMGKGKGKGKKRGRDSEGGEGIAAGFLGNEDGLTEGSAAYEHKRRRQASGGNSTSPSTKEKHTNPSRQPPVTKPSTPSTRTKQASSLSSNNSSLTKTIPHTRVTPKKSNPTEVLSTSLFSSLTPIEKLLTSTSPPQPSYDLAHSTNNLFQNIDNIDSDTESEVDVEVPTTPALPEKKTLHEKVQQKEKANEHEKEKRDPKEYERMNHLVDAVEFVEKRAASIPLPSSSPVATPSRNEIGASSPQRAPGGRGILSAAMMGAKSPERQRTWMAVNSSGLKKGLTGMGGSPYAPTASGSAQSQGVDGGSAIAHRYMGKSSQVLDGGKRGKNERRGSL
ncbi:MAG: hypothetical protein Q9166_000180 [cf. Caloplaca sp. 2 TL-2023]